MSISVDTYNLKREKGTSYYSKDMQKKKMKQIHLITQKFLLELNKINF